MNSVYMCTSCLTIAQNTEIVNIISTVGFPIACCCALFWFLTKEMENHNKESKAMQEALTDLKIAITELTAQLEQKGE